jgi:hypothetical protein
MQDGSSQWLQEIDKLKTWVKGGSPASAELTLRHLAGPRATLFQSLQATMQALQPVQRF